MGERGLTARTRWRSLGAVIAAMAVVNLVYGLSFPLLALVLDARGIDTTLIGLNTLVQASAVFAVAPIAPGLMQRFAPARLMQLSTAFLSVAFLLLWVFPSIHAWFAIRFAMGGMASLLWIASEALINDLAEDRWRGRVIGIYSSAGAAGFALGPLVLIATGSGGLLPFAVTSALILLAGLPLFLATSARPAQEPQSGFGLGRMIRLAPVIMLANLAYAACAESLGTFFPLFGLHLGLGEAGALTLMTIMGAGAIVLLLPLGWLADHVNRLALLTACVAVSIVGLLAMPTLVQLPVVAPVYAFFFGGIEGMIYALGVTLMGERFRGAALAAASTVFTAMWGAGTMLGPAVAGVGMDLFGAASLPYILALFFLLYLPLPLLGLLRGRRAA